MGWSQNQGKEPSSAVIVCGSAVICWSDGDLDYLACGGDRGLGMRGGSGRGYELVQLMVGWWWLGD